MSKQDVSFKNYITLGWVVGPLRPGGKEWIETGAKNFATNDMEKAIALFDKYPRCNTAILTGRVSGIVVIDIDAPGPSHATDGMASLKERGFTLPDTGPIVQTPTGGRHYYFKYPEGKVISSTSGILPGVDIRADNVHVVAPPSTTPDGEYLWISSYTNDLPDLPEWVFACRPAAKKAKNYATIDSDIPQGKRNETLYLHGVALREADTKPTQALKTLYEVNRKWCKPPLPDSEVENIFDSVFKKPSPFDGVGTPVKISRKIYNDLTASKEFLESNNNKFLYCNKLGGWFVWAGKRWKPDEVNYVQRCVIDLIQSIRKMAEPSKDKLLMNYAKSLGTANKVESILKLCKPHPDIAAVPEQFDSCPYILNLANGTLDMNSRIIGPHNPLDYLTKISPVRYDPDATCPKWINFLDLIFPHSEGSEDLKPFIKRMVGYWLFEGNPEQVMFIFYGTGRNGKSTFINVIRRLFGDYIKHAPIETFIDKRYTGVSNDLARLRGSRLVTTSETSSGQSLKEGIIKELTSGEVVTARFLYKEPFEFEPNFKICMSTNHKPNIKGTDEGIWRRILLIPFTYTIPEEQIVLNFERKLFDELPGILNWALEGYSEWRQIGLNPPATVKESVKEYRLEEDLFADFIDAYCYTNINTSCSVSEMKDAFYKWRDGRHFGFLKYKDLNEYLSQKDGIEKAKQTDNTYRWEGISIKIGVLDDDKSSF